MFLRTWANGRDHLAPPVLQPAEKPQSPGHATGKRPCIIEDLPGFSRANPIKRQLYTLDNEYFMTTSPSAGRNRLTKALQYVSIPMM